MGTTQNHAEIKSFMNLWPPSEDKRSNQVQLLSCLYLGACFYSRHDTFIEEKAGEHAKKIEEIAFAAANHRASINPNADGSSIAQFYAMETSKLFWDAFAETRSPNVREAFPGLKETVFDISTEKWRVLDARLARKLLRPLEEPGNSYTKIRFVNVSFEVDAARVAHRVLTGVQKTLKDVELKNFYHGKSEAKALEIMSIFSSAFEQCVLRSLNLELRFIAEKGFVAFEPLFKSQKMLEELKFSYTSISEKSARVLCESLPSVERIKCLHFFDTYSDDDGAERLSMLVEKCIALEDFTFSGSTIGKRGIGVLARALGQGSRLKTLNFNQNYFYAIGGICLSCYVIPKHLDLTEVHFDNMYLEDEGTIAIANGLKDAAPSLRFLSVRGNYISAKAAPALANCLIVKKLLTVFYAGENMLMDDGSVIICKAILEGNEWLKELDLSKNGMTDIGAKAAAKAVANKPYLSRLFIFKNLITTKGAKIVRDVLRKGTKGDYVLSELSQLNIWEGHYTPKTSESVISDSYTELKVKLKKCEVRCGSDSDTESDVKLKKRKVRHGSDSDTESEVKLEKCEVRHGSDSDTESEVKLKKRKVRHGSDSDTESEVKLKKRKVRCGSDSDTESDVKLK